MPHDNEKESRTLIQEALQDPLVRIPAPLKPAYYAHQKKLTLKYLLQVNLFAQLAYASYTLADILVLNDILKLLILTKISYTILIVLITIWMYRSEEHTSELQSRENLVCRLLLEKKKSKD